MQNVKHLLSVLNILENHHLHWTMNLRNRMMIMHRTTQWYFNLTHNGRVTHIFSFLQYTICLMPSHYLNQCWLIVNWTARNKFQWNFNQNTTVFIWENRFENSVYNMVAILSRTQCDSVILMVDNWLHDTSCGLITAKSLYDYDNNGNQISKRFENLKTKILILWLLVR